jgi:hypothetical protein
MSSKILYFKCLKLIRQAHLNIHEPSTVCRDFVKNLQREINYHNYLIMLDPTDYSILIKFCLENAIRLRDRQIYAIHSSSLNTLTIALYDVVTKYLDLLRVYRHQVIQQHANNHKYVEDSSLKVSPNKKRENSKSELQIIGRAIRV